MYVTIDIGNPRMTHNLLKGNPRTLMYASCNVYSHVQYVSCNGNSRVRTRVAMDIVAYTTQHLENLYGKLVEG